MKIPPANATPNGRPRQLPPATMLPAPEPGSAEAGALPIGDEGGIDPAAVPSRAAFDQAAGVAPPVVENVAASPGIAPAPAAADAAPIEFSAWYSLAHSGFLVAHKLTGLRALVFDPRDEAAQKAFRALYDTCAETPALQFLVRVGGKWGERIGAIAAFAIPMALTVRAELAARRGAASSPAAPGAPPAAANDNGPLPSQFVAEMSKPPA